LILAAEGSPARGADHSVNPSAAQKADLSAEASLSVNHSVNPDPSAARKAGPSVNRSAVRSADKVFKIVIE
jgi:hypothetical protein